MVWWFVTIATNSVIEWRVLGCTGSSNETAFSSGVFSSGAEPGVNDNRLILRVA